MNLNELNMLSLVALFASWAVVTGGTWKLFERIEKVSSEAAKKSTSEWLLHLTFEDRFINWADTFSGAFDSIFGTRHFSWKCFLKSSVASMVAVLIISLFWGFVRPEQLEMLIESDEFWFNLSGIFIIAAILNLLPDYLSLLESRYIISRLRKSSSFSKQIMLLTLDLVVTFAIGFIAFLALWGAFGSNPIDGFISIVLPLSIERNGEPSWGIWFYSTFFTSIWIWLYILSGFLISIQKFARLAIRRFRWFFDIEKKPFISLGGIAIILITVAYMIIIPVAWLANIG